MKQTRQIGLIVFGIIIAFALASSFLFSALGTTYYIDLSKGTKEGNNIIIDQTELYASIPDRYFRTGQDMCLSVVVDNSRPTTKQERKAFYDEYPFKQEDSFIQVTLPNGNIIEKDPEFLVETYEGEIYPTSVQFMCFDITGLQSRGDYHFYFVFGKDYQEPPQTECNNGEIKCLGYDKYICSNENWELSESNSEYCGYESGGNGGGNGGTIEEPSENFFTKEVFEAYGFSVKWWMAILGGLSIILVIL